MNQETLKELAEILREDCGLDLNPRDVFEVAQGLIGFFERLAELDIKIKNVKHKRHEVA